MYTREKNVQILISLLKHNKIKRVIASPGTTNMPFVASIQNDDFFEIISCVDERSACYMACGLAAETNEPVVITCTGATASRNYLSGLTEAYYRKLPILAVTCAQHFRKLGSYQPQCIDRSSQLNDIVNMSVHIPTINSSDDRIGANLLINKAILELKRRGCGPVHIDIETTSEGGENFDVKQLPHVNYVDRISYQDDFPELHNRKIGIFIGSHLKFSKNLIINIEQFCEKYNSVVLCDHTSNYVGRYRVLPNLIFDQDNYDSVHNDFDIIIHIGCVSGSYLTLKANEIWRVNPDGEIRDVFSKTRYVFEMDEDYFFNYYNSYNTNEVTDTTLYNSLKNEYNTIYNKINDDEIPLSNIWIAKNTIYKIPSNSCVHLAILNSLRSWNYFDDNSNLLFYTNTGGFGIDGPISTLIGASLANKDKNYYGIVGDLAFFYDLNSLGNRFVGNNIRIILINNGCGTEFHNYSHPAFKLGDKANDFIAADGHFGSKSDNLVRDFVKNLGFEYISAHDKNEFLSKIDYFCSDKIYSKPIVFEVFTNSNDESNALKYIRNLNYSFKDSIISNVKKNISPDLKNKIKKIVGK